MSNLETLFECIQKRPRPEDVADLVQKILTGHLSSSEYKCLESAARYSTSRMSSNYSSMYNDFAKATTGINKQISAASKIFNISPLSKTDSLDPDKVQKFVAEAGKQIYRAYKEVKKLNKAQRKACGIFKNARWYNKRFRLLSKIEKKLSAYLFNNDRATYARIGKSALSSQIPLDLFSKDINTACFVAYYSARMNLRSTFTNTSQIRAFDDISKMLFHRCKNGANTNWFAIAHVMPDQEVLEHLSSVEQGQMIGKWFELLKGMSGMLEGVWSASKFDRLQMVVSRGDDSSTWNLIASAWNKSREHWINLLYAMQAESILNTFCPGKVMRLMAADVAYWHRLSGGDIHPDTKVWAELPAPWDVFNGKIECGSELVKDTCKKFGVDADRWVAPIKNRKAVAFTPTPELVHGVIVSSPSLAAMLKKAGYFSGKEFKGIVDVDADIIRDKDGFAIGVQESTCAPDDEELR